MNTKFTVLVITTVASLLLPFSINAQALSEEEVKKANNPLADSKALNLQNYYIPSIYDDAGLKANSLLVRYSMPFAKGKVLVRFTMPLSTNPSGYNATGMPTYGSGLGDLNFFATYTFSKPSSKTLLGIGPQVVIPTASNHFTGSGKWQLGGAFVIFNTASPIVQWGSLITYQVSVAGQEDRSSTSNLAVQPFLLFQLGKGNYIRSTALWNFNLETDGYNVPLGIGVGHVLKVSKLVMNIFMEPQFTILHNGTGQPSLQIFGGINCQF
jgi:hypothetical protein